VSNLRLSLLPTSLPYSPQISKKKIISSEQISSSLSTSHTSSCLLSSLFTHLGEVIATPILSYLKDTPNVWLQKLVISLHKGEIDMFNLIVDNYKVQYSAQPALAAKHEDVKKKIVLLCLLNIAFEKPSYDRNITFTEIANKTRIPVDQVKEVQIFFFANFESCNSYETFYCPVGDILLLCDQLLQQLHFIY
jgi:hypothetical protein